MPFEHAADSQLAPRFQWSGSWFHLSLLFAHLYTTRQTRIVKLRTLQMQVRSEVPNPESPASSISTSNPRRKTTQRDLDKFAAISKRMEDLSAHLSKETDGDCQLMGQGLRHADVTHWGTIRLYWDNGKEHGNYYIIIP